MDYLKVSVGWDQDNDRKLWNGMTVGEEMRDDEMK